MAGSGAHQSALWPLALYLAAAVAVVAVILALSYLLGERHMERGTGLPYESGIVGTGLAESRFDVKYYLVAMFFLILDVESVFVFTWAISLREAGWAGYCSMLIFNGVLLATLAYLWLTGGLSWSTGIPRGERRHAGPAAPRRDDASIGGPASGAR